MIALLGKVISNKLDTNIYFNIFLNILINVILIKTMIIFILSVNRFIYNFHIPREKRRWVIIREAKGWILSKEAREREIDRSNAPKMGLRPSLDGRPPQMLVIQ